MNEANVEYYWDMLERYKFIERNEDGFRIHPLFVPIFVSSIEHSSKVTDAIVNSIMSYEQRLSQLEIATVADFLSTWLKKKNPNIAKRLKMEIDIQRVMYNMPNATVKFDDIMEKIRKQDVQ